MEKIYEEHDSSINLKANLVVLIVWLSPFLLNILIPQLNYLGFVIPAVFLFIEKKSELVRKHASQALVVSLIQFILYIIFDVVLITLLFRAWIVIWLFSGIISIVNIITFVIAIVQSFKGYQWAYLKLPVIGDFAETIEKTIKS